MKIVQGDITKSKTDAIVNAANPYLFHGGGVCGAIYDAIEHSGKNNYQKFMNEIDTNYKPDENRIRIGYGEHAITSAPGLNCKCIIHTVGPTDDLQEKDQKIYVYKCCFKACTILLANKMKSIAFPFISTGIYNCDKTLVSDVMKKAFKDVEEFNKDIEIVVYLFKEEDMQYF